MNVSEQKSTSCVLTTDEIVLLSKERGLYMAAATFRTNEDDTWSVRSNGSSRLTNERHHCRQSVTNIDKLQHVFTSDDYSSTV